MNKLMYINQVLNGFVWGKYMIFFLLFTGIWLMIVTNFLPFRKIKLIFHKTLGALKKTNAQEGITPFQAVSTALAGTLGVGSVVGVTTALTMGGPGALFWMLISAIPGMMSKYAEIVLAIHYRERSKDGSYIGGPMTTLEHGLHLRFFGVLFAVFCVFASFGIGNLTPANTIAHTLQTYLPLSPMLIGIVLALIIGIIMLGKAKGIMRFNEIIIPIISIGYVLACIYLLLLHMDELPHVFTLIFDDAFDFMSAAGGISGFAISRAMHYGISRGVFSNEAGMGSSPLSHAAVVNVNAVEQGFWGIFEVFFDTIIVCTLTGLVVLSSDAWGQSLEGVALTVACFEEGFGTFGGMLFAIAIISFALPSILGWYYYAITCLHYLFKTRIMIVCYSLLFLVLLIYGCGMELGFVWEVADTLNGLMAIPNLISLVLLYKTVVKLTKEYLRVHRSD